jgi:glycosyltransferase involved in cell wall biosynthesis
MAALVSSLRGLPWIFDVRGLLAQEYVDAERWPAGGLLDRLTRSAERSLVRRADGLVFLTRRVVAQLREDGTVHEGQPVGIIPCAVDVDRFSPDLGARVRIRRELGLGNRPVMTYAGSLGSWYLPAAMLDFFDAARSSLPGLHFLVLTPQAPVMGREVARRGFERDVTVRTVSPAAVPAHLAAADFGISFIAASPSKIASSPTKLAEYLACGLPVVVNPGVGDVEELKQEPAWVVVDRLDRESYERAALRLRGLLAQPDGRETARELAVRRFALARAVEAYDDLYRRLVVGRCA